MSDDAPEQALPDLAVLEAELSAVDRALQRLDDGSYGRCAVCGEPVAETDLEADPLAERCDRHAVSTGASIVDPEPDPAVWQEDDPGAGQELDG